MHFARVVSDKGLHHIPDLRWIGMVAQLDLIAALFTCDAMKKGEFRTPLCRARQLQRESLAQRVAQLIDAARLIQSLRERTVT